MGKQYGRRNSSSYDDEDSSDISVKETMVKKAAKRKIRPLWLETFGDWLTKVECSSGGYKLHCKACNATLKGSGGRTDLIKHQNTTKHKKRTNCVDKNQIATENDVEKMNIEKDVKKKTIEKDVKKKTIEKDVKKMSIENEVKRRSGKVS